MTGINIKPRIISYTDMLCKIYFQYSIKKSVRPKWIKRHDYIHQAALFLHAEISNTYEIRDLSNHTHYFL